METLITDCGRTPGEQRDCTVRATASALGIPYVEAHAKLKALGRKDGHRFRFWTHAETLGFTLRPDLALRAFEKILPEMAQGRFIVRISRHVFAVVNGTVIDLELPKAKCRVKMVYEYPAS